MTYRAIIADDHALVREGIRAMLATEGDLRVVAQAENGHEAYALCRRLEPDLVLMDVRMPGMDGLADTRAVKAACPGTAVLIVTTHESADYLLEAIKGGAAGYVLKESTRDELVGAVRKVRSGDSPLEPNLAMRLLKRLSADEAPPSEAAGPAPEAVPAASDTLPTPLSPRELEVLAHICLGRTNRQIAEGLYLSISTVKNYLERINQKLEVSDRTQAAVRAIELGLVRPGGRSGPPRGRERAI
jgi:DNA-binding NarL/FixJ family response regulator